MAQLKLTDDPYRIIYGHLTSGLAVFFLFMAGINFGDGSPRLGTVLLVVWLVAVGLRNYLLWDNV